MATSSKPKTDKEAFLAWAGNAPPFGPSEHSYNLVWVQDGEKALISQNLPNMAARIFYPYFAGGPFNFTVYRGADHMAGYRDTLEEAKEVIAKYAAL